MPEFSTNMLYLGMPLPFGTSKTKLFQFLLATFQNKIQNWRARFLSKAGRTVMIKSVLQSLPLHVMNCYKLPLTFCKKLCPISYGTQMTFITKLIRFHGMFFTSGDSRVVWVFGILLFLISPFSLNRFGKLFFSQPLC